MSGFFQKVFHLKTIIEYNRFRKAHLHALEMFIEQDYSETSLAQLAHQISTVKDIDSVEFKKVVLNNKDIICDLYNDENIYKNGCLLAKDYPYGTAYFCNSKLNVCFIDVDRMPGYSNNSDWLEFGVKGGMKLMGMRDFDLAFCKNIISHHESIITAHRNIIKQLLREDERKRFNEEVAFNVRRSRDDIYKRFLRSESREDDDFGFCLKHLAELDRFIDEDLEKKVKELRRKYSEGVKHYLEIHDNQWVIDNIDRIREYDINKRYEDLIVQDEKRSWILNDYLVSEGKKEVDKLFCIEHINEIDSFALNTISKKYLLLKRYYPMGVEEYGRRYKGRDEKWEALQNVETIKIYQKRAKEIKRVTELLNAQGVYTNVCFGIVDEILDNWGCYFYSFDIKFENTDGNSNCDKYVIRQAFHSSYSRKYNFDEKYLKKYLSNNDLKEEMRAGLKSFVHSVYNKIIQFVEELNKRFENDVFVVFGDSGVGDDSLIEMHFGYLKQTLSDKGFLDKGEKKHCVLIELITSKEHFDDFCKEIKNRVESKKTKDKKECFNLFYLSLFKEFDRNEINKIIEKQKKKEQEELEREKKKKEEIERKKIEANNAILDRYGIKHLYHMTSISNLRNILANGLLNYYDVRSQGQIKKDISMQEVQDIRNRKREPIHGRIIHEYVPMYFNPKNPMLYVRRELQSTIVILKLDRELIFKENSVFTDGNAANAPTRFFNNLNDLDQLDWDCLNDDYWTDYEDGKRKRCAEVLAYSSIPASAIKGIACMNLAVKDYVMQNIVTDNDIPVLIDSSLFFPY